MSSRRALLAAAAASPLAGLLAGCAAPLRSDPALRGADFVLLGELHDNPEHHRLRAALLAALLADRRPTRVVFEQMDRGRDDALAAARDAEAVAEAGALDRRAWDWPLHRPIVEAALAGGARIVGGNLSRADARAIVRGGAAAVPAELQRWLGDVAWGAVEQAALERLIDEGHCGLLPAAQAPGMALAQRARDAALAQAMLDAAPGERAVLIAGNGHVRSDLGVPRLLRAAGVPADRIVAIVYLEQGDPPLPADRSVRTLRVDRRDPCETLRRPARAGGPPPGS